MKKITNPVFVLSAIIFISSFFLMAGIGKYSADYSLRGYQFFLNGLVSVPLLFVSLMISAKSFFSALLILVAWLPNVLFGLSFFSILKNKKINILLSLVAVLLAFFAGYCLSGLNDNLIIEEPFELQTGYYLWVLSMLALFIANCIKYIESLNKSSS